MIFLYFGLAITFCLFGYFCIKFICSSVKYTNIDYYSTDYSYDNEEQLKFDKEYSKKKTIQFLSIIYVLCVFIFFVPKLIINDFSYNPIQFVNTFNSLSKSYNANLVIKKLNVQKHPEKTNVYNINYKFDEDLGIEGEINKETNCVNKLAISYRLDGKRDINDFVVAINIATRISNNYISDEEIEKVFKKLDLYKTEKDLTEFKECVYKDVKYSFGSIDNTDIIHFKIEKVYNDR